MKVYKKLAQNTQIFHTADKMTHVDHAERRIDEIMDNAPSGSGFDAGTKYRLHNSKPNRLEFHVGYHHMNENGFYTGWTYHKITVKPSLIHGFDLKVYGRNVNNIKEYVEDVFHEWLNSEVEW